MPRNTNTDTPDFDADVMSQLGDDAPGNDEGGQSGGDDGDDNSQPSDRGSQQQSSQQDSQLDGILDRIDGKPPEKKTEQQTQQPQNKQGQQQQQQGRKKTDPVVDEHGRPIPNDARHHFFARKNAEKALRASQTELATIKPQLEAFQQLHQAAASSGLSPQEQATALQLGASLKKDVLGTIKQLLTEAKAAGINIDGAIGVSSLDTASVASLIEQKLKPLTDRLSQQQQQQNEYTQRHAEATEEATEFFGEFPDAMMHHKELNNLLQRHETWSLREAWAELRLAAREHGLDLSQPLAPQIAAKRGQQQQRRPENSGGSHVPMNGGGRGGNGNLRPQQTDDTSFGHDAESRDIVKWAMKQAGMDVSRL